MEKITTRKNTEIKIKVKHSIIVIKEEILGYLFFQRIQNESHFSLRLKNLFLNTYIGYKIL